MITEKSLPGGGEGSPMISRVGIGLIVNTKLKRSPCQGGFTYAIEDWDLVDSRTTLQKSPYQGGGGFTYDIEDRDWVDSKYKIKEKSLPGEGGGGHL